MELGNLVNDNISKKMGIIMFSMYLASQCEDIEMAYVVAGSGVIGAGYQCVVDAIKAWGGE